jgi:hypothetical protein
MNIGDVAREHLTKMTEAIQKDIINQVLPMEFTFTLGEIEVYLNINPGMEVIDVRAKKWLPMNKNGRQVKKSLRTVLDLNASPVVEPGGESLLVTPRDFDADKAALDGRNRERSEDLT